MYLNKGIEIALLPSQAGFLSEEINILEHKEHIAVGKLCPMQSCEQHACRQQEPRRKPSDAISFLRQTLVKIPALASSLLCPYNFIRGVAMEVG